MAISTRYTSELYANHNGNIVLIDVPLTANGVNIYRVIGNGVDYFHRFDTEWSPTTVNLGISVSANASCYYNKPRFGSATQRINDGATVSLTLTGDTSYVQSVSLSVNLELVFNILVIDATIGNESISTTNQSVLIGGSSTYSQASRTMSSILNQSESPNVYLSVSNQYATGSITLINGDVIPINVPSTTRILANATKSGNFTEAMSGSIPEWSYSGTHSVIQTETQIY